jgi:Zn-dependent peptidase ImmA (M78 family)
MAALPVPFMLAKDVERAAESLLHDYVRARGGGTLRGAVNVDFIVENILELDLAVIDLKGLLANPSVLGMTSVEDRRICVDQSLEKIPGRFAFTLAHEIGHWQLHRQILEQRQREDTLFDLERLPSPAPRPGRRRKAPVEWQADQFAACLLMPARLVREAVRLAFGERLPSWEGIEARLLTGEPDERFVEVAEQVIAAGQFDNVSNMAMRIRLRDLKLVVDASDPQRSLL